MLNLEKSYLNDKCNKIPILMYHRFINDKSKKGKSRIYVDIKKFEQQLKMLKANNYETITFADLLDDNLISKLEQGYKFVIITVDDGYLDNYELLFPLLKKYNFKAVIYVVTGVNYNKWDVDKLQEPKIPLMNTEQIKEMVASGLVEIGGHTMNHPDLTKLTKEQQYQEINENKLQLEDIIKQDIISFAYPYGFFNKDSKEIVKNLGYKFAVMTENAPKLLQQDLYQIKRIPVFPWDNTFVLRLKVSKYYWNYIRHIYNVVIKVLVYIKKVVLMFYPVIKYAKGMINQ
jgi:peptidoglycan/xylan/chitin deacetylase (PgdA/CDA1 family)